ncbi:precorrin-8X methylmutase [Ruminiclostridium cellulolyticum]|uniref:Precorrin-8X methylmutase CbiC/CobH n=1 Tax=Ruminiclostridium cellulolyticum (strain ATCC 35319 / DSM 5812 / JCM 6584 / H10) TaxID=394503 RepID=B8I0R6_RUMCH|nr:precorrin-8X methylmutase [Ruminiclostridium cellulolyticum]ACL75641.1 Precorrin-8X methylmutase CbiC/CobH [Ruminiclostridium cellulolyticum H10]
MEIMKPMDIENKSFEIISHELGDRVLDKNCEPVIKRVIHTTADFEYADNLVFSEGVIEKSVGILKAGACIVTDTQMAMAGINKAAVARCSCEVMCFMSNSEVAEQALAEGTTRAAISMRKAAEIEKPLIIVVGNAPTALIELNNLINEGKVEPKLIVGVPVGFVNVVESKELIINRNIPSIVARGRKGGSNVAAAIVNALLYMASPRNSNQ